MKLKYWFLFIMIFFIGISFVSALDEEVRFICGGNSELKILCSGQVEQLYEIPENLQVSIQFPDGTDINTFAITLHTNLSNNIAICNYSLDGAANISMGAADYNFNIPITISNGNRFIDVWCRDTFNLNNSYHDSVSFYVYSVIAPSNFGSGSIIKLYRLEIFGDRWKFDFDNTVNVFVYDLHDRLMDPDFLDIKIVSDVEINSEFVARMNIGKYKGVFNIPESDTKLIILNITAKEEGKVISELFEIATEKAKTIDEFKKSVADTLEKVENFWTKYKFYIYLFLVLILLCIIWRFAIILSKRRKEKK